MILEEGIYQAKVFAGSGKQGTLDGIPTQVRFNFSKGIAVHTKCFVGDINCIRAIYIEGNFIYMVVHNY